MKSFPIHIARPGFTLVELLLVMAIIGVLSSLALVVVNEAQYDARVSATQSRINMLDQIMRQKMEQIQERRLPLDLGPPVAVDRAAARSLRRRAKADMLDVEMPRSMWDIAYERSTANDNDCTFPSRNFSKWIQNATEEVNGDNQARLALIEALADTAPSNALRFRFDIQRNYNYRIDDPQPTNPPYQNPADYPEGREVDNIPFTFLPEDPASLDAADYAKLTTVSEYLYLILQSTQFNGISAVEAMGNRAFGDTDGDGFLEVVDSWGNPIAFQFEMYFEDGELYRQLPLSPEPVDLNAGLDYRVGPNNISVTDMLDIEHIQIRFVSTGGRKTLAQQSRELITN